MKSRTLWLFFLVFFAILTVLPAEESPATEEAGGNTENMHLLILRVYKELLERFINGDIILNEQDILEMEQTINRLENSLPRNP